MAEMALAETNDTHADRCEIVYMSGTLELSTWLVLQFRSDQSVSA